MSISVNASAPAAAGETQQSSATPGSEMQAAYRAESQKMIDPRSERDDRNGGDGDRAREHKTKPRKKKVSTGMVVTVGPMLTYHLREQTVLLKLKAKTNVKQVGQTALSKSGPQALERMLGEQLGRAGKAKPVDVREAAVGPQSGEMKVGRKDSESPASLSATSAALRAAQPKSSVASQVASHNTSQVASQALSQVASAFASVTASKKEQQHSNAESGADTRGTVALSAHMQQATTIGTRAASHAASSEAAPQPRRQLQSAAGGRSSATAPEASTDAKGTSVRYSFKTWAGQPAVDVRLDAQQAAQIVTAHASSDGVRDALRQHSSLLSSDMTLRFERQQADDDRDQAGRQQQQQQEADEQ